MDWKQFLKKYWLLIILFIALIYILFPKPCGGEYGKKEGSWIFYSKGCECYGKKISTGSILLSSNSCIGICVSCRCSQGGYMEGYKQISCDSNIFNFQSYEDVVCKYMNENNMTVFYDNVLTANNYDFSCKLTREGQKVTCKCSSRPMSELINETDYCEKDSDCVIDADNCSAANINHYKPDIVGTCTWETCGAYCNNNHCKLRFCCNGVPCPNEYACLCNFIVLIDAHCPNGNLNVTVRNVGTNKITVSSLKFYVNGEGIVPTCDGNLNPTEVTINPDDIMGCSLGHELSGIMNVTIVSPSNVVERSVECK